MNHNKTIRATPIGRGAPDLPDRGPAWMTDERRGCAPDHLRPLFYSAKDTAQNKARQICLGSRRVTACPFRDACLTWALDSGERHGVWAGVLMSSTAERQRALARQVEAVAA